MEDLCQDILAQGGGVDAVDFEGKTALICACQEGHVAIARVLIKAGAQLDMQSNSSERKRDKMFGRTALLEACYQGHTEIVESLIEGGASLEIPDVLGRTPLIAACLGGHHETTKLLTSAGGNLNAQDNDGISPLIAIAGKRHGRGTEVMIGLGLINVGSDVNLCNKHRQTALMCAIEHGHTDLAVALKKAGAK